ncbi:MAG TPA: glycosyltransferase family 4 protein [Allosphingosinicella sp.]|jgi:glycosyltransferase involved in cell wall biosynthesis
MRILYLTHFFDPEPNGKSADFVRALQARGHEVEVVTGFPNYPAGKLYPGYRVRAHQKEMMGDVEVHRVAVYPSHDRSSLRRMLNYLSFTTSATVYGLFKARRFDVIYAYSPPTVGLAAAVIGFFRRRPFVQDVQDLWPESVTQSGMPGTGRMGTLLGAMCRFIYRRSARVVAQSRGMAAKIAERGIGADRIDVIFNWADEDSAKPLGTCDLSGFGLEGRFNIIYGGNLGAMQGLETLIRAAHAASSKVPHLQLLLIGGGTEAAALKELVAELGATNVRIEPGVPRTQIGDVFAAADVLTLHLKNLPLFEFTIPQKTQFYMAAGKPILVAVPGEAAAMVTDAGAGLAAQAEDVEAVADAMVRMAEMPREELAAMGLRGQVAYRQLYSLDAGIDATIATLEAAIAGRRPRRG